MSDFDVLNMFAWLHGRRWKQALRDTWMRACADQPEEWRGALQRLRNDLAFGPSGLLKYKVPTVQKIQEANAKLARLKKESSE